MRQQPRIICDNRVDDAAEPAPQIGVDTVDFKVFQDMIAPAFTEKASRQDVMACLKRAHWIVNMPQGVYVRPAGTSTEPLKRVPYTDGITDFVSPEGKKVIQ